MTTEPDTKAMEARAATENASEPWPFWQTAAKVAAERAEAAEAEASTLRQKLERAEANMKIVGRERGEFREKLATACGKLMVKDALLAETGKALDTTQTALEHASFALDGVVATDDEDEGKDGGSDTCQHAKKTVDNALKKVVALSAKIKEAERFQNGLGTLGKGLPDDPENVPEKENIPVQSWSGWRSTDTAPEDQHVILATSGGHVGEAIMLVDEDTGRQKWAWALGPVHPKHVPWGWQPLPNALNAPVLSDLRPDGFDGPTGAE